MLSQSTRRRVDPGTHHRRRRSILAMCFRRCPTSTRLRRADWADLRGALLCDLACRLSLSCRPRRSYARRRSRL